MMNCSITPQQGITANDLLEMIKEQEKIEIHSYRISEDINIQDLVMNKIGASHYLRTSTIRGEDIYQFKKTTLLVAESFLSIAGEPKDTENAHQELEKRLDKKLETYFIKNGEGKSM